MIRIDFTVLNTRERQIHQRLQEASASLPTLRIADAAALCGCSVSKISKFTKRLGFVSFRHYVEFLYGKEPVSGSRSQELSRVQQFISQFDESLVEEMIALIDKHTRILLFGYGPSLLCAQYIEYRLRTSCPKVVISVVDDLSVATMTDTSTLLLIFTVTGAYRDFKPTYNAASRNGAQVVIVAQNYNISLIDQCDKIFFLTENPNPEDIAPYEQSRTLFFIFMEEVIQRIARSRAETLQSDTKKIKSD
ncbi:MAG: SIS domain-containing protein [Spirochaetia bacterium]|nr:SIS domain-containing protein [Spirochaetia bacterium]